MDTSWPHPKLVVFLGILIVYTHHVHMPVGIAGVVDTNECHLEMLMPKHAEGTIEYEGSH